MTDLSSLKFWVPTNFFSVKHIAKAISLQVWVKCFLIKVSDKIRTTKWYLMVETLFSLIVCCTFYNLHKFVHLLTSGSEMSWTCVMSYEYNCWSHNVHHTQPAKIFCYETHFWVFGDVQLHYENRKGNFLLVYFV